MIIIIITTLLSTTTTIIIIAIVYVPIVQAIRAAGIDCALHLLQSHAGGGMVDVVVVVWEIECLDYGGAEVLSVVGDGGVGIP